MAGAAADVLGFGSDVNTDVGAVVGVVVDVEDDVSVCVMVVGDLDVGVEVITAVVDCKTLMLDFGYRENVDVIFFVKFV